MSKIQIQCAQCGIECGNYYEAQLSGPPEDCSPAEYDSEPCCTDSEGNEFCSRECADEYHGVDAENIVDDEAGEDETQMGDCNE